MENTWGTPVVPGYAYAPVHWITHPHLPQNFQTVPDNERAQHHEKFDKAVATIASRLNDRANKAVGAGAEIIMASAMIVQDPGLSKKVHQAIDNGDSAQKAVIDTINIFVDIYSKQGGLLAERVTDLHSIRDRLLAELQGLPEPGIPELHQPTIIFADDLSPIDTAGMDPAIIKAIVTRQGGPTSHTSIIARQLGIPCIVAARFLPHDVPDMVYVDAVLGMISFTPDVQAVTKRIEQYEKTKTRAQTWQPPAVTADGTRIYLFSNVHDKDAARADEAALSDGVGVLRTELSFLSADHEATHDEQVGYYLGVFGDWKDNPVYVRTLHVGSEKPFSWMPLDAEANPGLGVRGIRTSGPHPFALYNQLDAIADAKSRSGAHQVGVMAPMVSTLSEARWFAHIVHERYLQAGIVVEVPAAAVMAKDLLDIVDFILVDTNNLTQYIMAADRMNPALATYNDIWQPAVLRTISRLINDTKQSDKPVIFYGAAPADPMLACVLIGMGARRFSVATNTISHIGSAINRVTVDQCEDIAKAVLTSRDPGEARQQALRILQDLYMG